MGHIVGRGALAVAWLSAQACGRRPAHLDTLVGEVSTAASTTHELVLRTDDGVTVHVLAQGAAVERALPGAEDTSLTLRSALADVQCGDRVLARGRLSSDATILTARQVVLLAPRDLRAPPPECDIPS